MLPSSSGATPALSDPALAPGALPSGLSQNAALLRGASAYRKHSDVPVGFLRSSSREPSASQHGTPAALLEGSSGFHANSLEAVFGQVGLASSSLGLSATMAAERLAQFGPNQITQAPSRSFLWLVLDQVSSPLVILLIIAAIVSGAFQQWPEMGLILAVVAGNTALGVYQEASALKASDALKSMLSSKAIVIRDGMRAEIDADQLVPGDVVFIESGSKVAADLRLFQVTKLEIAESMLTGESKAAAKQIEPVPLLAPLGDRKSMAYSATLVVKGQGLGVVVATGDDTEIGKISLSVAGVKPKPTGLQKQLSRFGIWIGVITVPIACGSFGLSYSVGAHKNDLPGAFIEATAIAVAMIPAGLPAVLAMTLSLGMRHMARNRAIIKTLPAVETLGSVMVICSDKTGTLTRNEMTCVAVACPSLPESELAIPGVGYDSVGHRVEANAEVIRALTVGCVCNDAIVKRSDSGGVVPVGDPTELALVVAAEKLGMDVNALRTAMPRIDVVPFESEHKYMATSHKEGESTVVFCKGAPDRLLARCQWQEDGTGAAVPLDQTWWTQAVSRLAGKGCRTLALARFRMPMDDLQNGTMLAVVAILDPPREECRPAIELATSASIAVKMITGDHIDTAKAIARALGIPTHDAVEGWELDAMGDDEFAKRAVKCNVFARTSPENKLRIVLALQKQGLVCSMTGDGVNDAPALKQADMGVAMGITGTDVARDAAKMILLDDKFSTILVAVKEGRRIWDNLRKILIFNQPVNFAQGFIIFFSLCLDTVVPLSALQILYVNLATALSLGFMLGMEPPEPDLMQRPPRRSDKSLMGKLFLWRCLFVTVLLVVVNLGAVAWAIDANMANGQLHALSLNVLVWCEVAYAINCRFIRQSSLHIRALRGNWGGAVASVFMIGSSVFCTYCPGVNTFFSMEPMQGWLWALVVLFSVLVFLIVEVEKAVTPWVSPWFIGPLNAALRALDCPGERETTCCSCCYCQEGGTCVV